MKAENTVQMVISHTEEVKVTDLNMTIENASNIVADEKILYAFNVFLKELHSQGYDFDLIGGEDDD